IFLVQPLIILFFGIPFTLKLKSFNMLNGNGPLIGYIQSLIILPSIFALITWGLHSWFPKHVLGYWGGVAMILILGIKKCGANPENISEYIRNNSKMIKPDMLRLFLGETPQNNIKKS